jgi:hypothetical protein
MRRSRIDDRGRLAVTHQHDKQIRDHRGSFLRIERRPYVCFVEFAERLIRLKHNKPIQDNE